MKLVEKVGFETPEGINFPIYRDWDEFHDEYDVKMVYATTMKPNTTKGPILHKQRKYFITAISGTVKLEFYKDNKLQTVILHDERNPARYNIVMLDEGIPIRLLSIGNEEATIINCPSKSWHPDNPDTIKYTSWEDYQRGS